MKDWVSHQVGLAAQFVGRKSLAKAKTFHLKVWVAAMRTKQS